MVQFVIKRDGTTEAFDADKLNKWAEWASQTCDVSWSDVLFSAIRVLGDTAKSSDIHSALIKTCVERKDRGHVKMAARLLLGQIYKEAFGDFSIPSLKDFYSYMVRAGHWDYMGYTDSELDELDNVIDHPADFTYEYATLKQFYDKYAICTNDNCHESPQMMSMGMAMSNNRDEHPSTRLKSVIEAYQEFKSLKINLPTPSLNGERTNMQGAPSCCVITAGDSMKSIGAATHVAYEMTANRSGIGIEYDTRSINDPVKGGRVKHTGKFPLYGYLDKAVKAMCYDPETEVLTSRGFKLFRDLTPEDLVAQVNHDRTVEFVKPTEYVALPFSGTMYHFHKKGVDIMVTDNHQMANRRVRYGDKTEQTSDGYEFVRADEFVPSRCTAWDFGASLNGDYTDLTPLDRLRIAF